MKKEHREAALKALNEYFKTTHTDLLKLLREELYCLLITDSFPVNGISETPEGDILIQGYYSGKWCAASDRALLECIAPFCANSKMTYSGEDGLVWQFAISNGALKKLEAYFKSDSDTDDNEYKRYAMSDQDIYHPW